MQEIDPEKQSTASRGGPRRPLSAANSADEESNLHSRRHHVERRESQKNPNLQKFINKGKSADLPGLYQKQENYLKLIKKEFGLVGDSAQVDAQLSQLLVQNDIHLVGPEVLNSSSDAINEVQNQSGSASPPRSKLQGSRYPTLKSLDRLASPGELTKTLSSPQVKRARAEYHAKKLSINLYRMMILLQKKKAMNRLDMQDLRQNEAVDETSGKRTFNAESNLEVTRIPPAQQAKKRSSVSVLSQGGDATLPSI